MANDMSPNRSPGKAAIGDVRPVPGPRSKAIFDAEAEVMAPGLQSIALYSQLAVDHAHGCTIIDADGAEYLDFIAGIAVGSLGHSHPHYVKRLREQLDRSTFGSFTTETRARFLNLVAACCRRGSPMCSSSRAAPRRSRLRSASPSRSPANSSSSASGAAFTARPRALSACSEAARNHQGRSRRHALGRLTPIATAAR